MADKDKKLPDMIRDLDTNISRLNDQLMMLSAQLEEGIFVDALHITTPTPVLAELDKVCYMLHINIYIYITYYTTVGAHFNTSYSKQYCCLYYCIAHHTQTCQ
jgi:hypothetical protein